MNDVPTLTAPNAPSVSPVGPGDVLADKYKVERVLAIGGMGVVVAARHLHLDERYAIKFLQPDALSNVEAVSRFAREARAAVRIKSEHVARVIDVGTLEVGGPFMVMEYLEGEDLSTRIERTGRVPIMEAVDFVLQACEAIAEAHVLGIIHRDLKPGNIFLTERADGTDCVKVLDFGISKVDSRISRVSAELTTATAVMGSPLYMAPEQMRASRDIDARVDIWALGMILYECLVGQAAFDGESIPEICLKIYNDTPPSIRASRPEVSEDLERLVMTALEKDPAKRYATIGDFATALLPFGPHRARISVERVHGTLNRAGILTGPLEPEVIALDAKSMTDAMRAARRTATPAVWDAPKQKKRSPFVWAIAPLAIGVLGIGVFVARFVSAPSAPRVAAGEAPPIATEAAKPEPAKPSALKVEAAAAPSVEAPSADASAADKNEDAEPSSKSKARKPRLVRVAPPPATTVTASAKAAAAPAATPPPTTGLFDPK
jgi:tRNA A-37 threonylcarbamoyl transferase component Bud32